MLIDLTSDVMIIPWEYKGDIDIVRHLVKGNSNKNGSIPKTPMETCYIFSFINIATNVYDHCTSSLVHCLSKCQVKWFYRPYFYLQILLL